MPYKHWHFFMFSRPWNSGQNSSLALKLERSDHKEHVFKFQVDFNFTKNYCNQKLEPEARQMDKRTKGHTDRKTMSINIFRIVINRNKFKLVSHILFIYHVHISYPFSFNYHVHIKITTLRFNKNKIID